jgi:hypothetical protein
VKFEIRAPRGERAYAEIDAADYAELSRHKWALDKDGYAYRFVQTHGHRRRISMHRQLLGLGSDDQRHSDHINGDRLDNRRSNLRIVTQAQNNQNVCGGRGPSGRRNVYWHTASGQWRVAVSHNGRQISGGYFKSLDSAIAAAAHLRQRTFPFSVEARS